MASAAVVPAVSSSKPEIMIKAMFFYMGLVGTYVFVQLQLELNHVVDTDCQLNIAPRLQEVHFHLVLTMAL